MRRIAPLLIVAAGVAAYLVRRRASAGADSGMDASPTAPDPAVRAAATAATPPGPPPASTPEPGSATPPSEPAPSPLSGDAQTVGLYALHEGPRAERARASLVAALGEQVTLTDPDNVGRFDAQLPAESPAAAEQIVRDALGHSGTGDDFTVVTTPRGREMPSDDPRQPG